LQKAEGRMIWKRGLCGKASPSAGYAGPPKHFLSGARSRCPIRTQRTPCTLRLPKMTWTVRTMDQKPLKASLKSKVRVNLPSSHKLVTSTIHNVELGNQEPQKFQ
jgi:hypothetical protein